VLQVAKLPGSCLKELHHPVHPLARSRRTWLRYRQQVFEMSFHLRVPSFTFHFSRR
jgi:hypothetical protein